MISRRRFLATAAALGATATAALGATATADAPGLAEMTPGRDPLLPLWQAWKRLHVSSAGRVIDRLQQNVSHSEGQGYAPPDRRGPRRPRRLRPHPRLDPRQPRRPRRRARSPGAGTPPTAAGVTDTNNASDGDLFAAWALIRAADRFAEPRYREIGGAIATDLAAACVVPSPGPADGLVLLPGAQGFEVADGYVLNPAYYMLRALAEVGAATGQASLVTCAADGNALLSRLARERLVPDWVRVTPAGFAPAEGKSANFGYEALRVPLYLVWSGLPGHPAVTRARDAYRAARDGDIDGTPTVIDPATGETRQASTDPGYRALAALTDCADGRAAAMPAFAAGQPYYPGALQLLSLLAQRETTLGCYVR